MKIYKHNQSLVLESGEKLNNLEIAYNTYGDLKNPVIWVCHALTANSDVADWWAGVFGKGKLLDPEKYFIICANVLGSSYGTTGPDSINPENGERYGLDFPFITMRDMASTHKILKEHLKIHKIHLLIGASLGGMQAMEWAMTSSSIQNLVIIASNGFHSPWGIAFNETQRMCLETDPTFRDNDAKAGSQGIKAARALALLSYRNYNLYKLRQEEKDLQKIDNFKASSYQRYQGEKLAKRFSAHSYYTLSKAMDSHNVCRDRGIDLSVMSAISAKSLFIGIKSDLLFPPVEVKSMQKHVPNSIYKEIDSDYGHDGFLIAEEQELLSKMIQDFIENE